MKNISKYLWGASKTKWVIIASFVAIFIIGLVIGLLIKSGGVEDPVKKTASTAETESKILFWTCSMDPQIKQDGPGRCPICGMDLVPMREEAGGGEKASLKLGERARHLASVSTTQVNYRKLSKSIYTVGKIDYDEGRVVYVTVWVSGRVDKLYVNFTGTIVKKDDPLVYLYSPDLLSAQDEYLLAYLGIEQLKQSPLPGAFAQSPLPGAIAQSPLPGVIASSRSLYENARRRLLLWGITVEQIEELERVQKPQIHLTLSAPIGGTIIDKDAFEGMYFKTGDRLFTIADLSRVWLYLDIYEYDIPWIKHGQDVEVITESYPGGVFHGTVAFIDPFLDEMTRTVKVRINMDNHERKLKPGMYVNARLKVELGGEDVVLDSKINGKYMCPMHPDVISDKHDKCSECGMKLEPVGGGIGEYVPDLVQLQYECPKQCEGSISDAPGHCSVCWRKLVKKDQEELEPVEGKMGMVDPGQIQSQYECPIQCEGSASDTPGHCSVCWSKLVKKEDREEREPVEGKMGMVDPGQIQSQYECPMQCEGSASDTPGYCSMCWRKLVKKEDQEEKTVHVDEQHVSPGKYPANRKNLKIKDDIGVIAVPHSSVLFSGKRNIVYVEKKEGSYVPREIIIGPKADEYYPVISGLSVGEKVVTSGTFLIDSQMQLLGKPSLLFSEGSTLDETIQEKKEDISKARHKHENHASGEIKPPDLRKQIKDILDNYYAIELGKLIENILDNYYAIAVKLSSDSVEDIDKNLALIAGSSRKARDINTLEIPSERLIEITKKIEEGANGIRGTELEDARNKFKDLSQSAILLLKEFYTKMKDSKKTYIYYCSMVDASWLQEKKGALNPYYGSVMLKCGSIKEELP